MNKKHFNKNNICIFASELSALIGLNNFKKPSETLYRIWEKNFPQDFERIYKSLGTQAKLKEDDKTIFKKIEKKYNKKIDLKKCIASKDVTEMKQVREQLLKECEDLNLKDKQKIKESIINLTNTGFGTKNESKSLHIYTQLTGIPVITISDFYKRIIMKTGDHNWYIGGRIDGICKDNTIIEVKNRMHKLFYNLREYEKVQTYCYMYILESKKSKLVETYMKNQQPEVNTIDIDFEDMYWDYIFVRIHKFILYFTEFIKNDDLKKNLLSNGVENFELNLYD
tara:strand:+ start:1583 stop:2428 length:846 start_codon:yes stop_codon:yes gene_type:complete